jgi:hypothetical protein
MCEDISNACKFTQPFPIMHAVSQVGDFILKILKFISQVNRRVREFNIHQCTAGAACGPTPSRCEAWQNTGHQWPASHKTGSLGGFIKYLLELRPPSMSWMACASCVCNSEPILLQTHRIGQHFLRIGNGSGTIRAYQKTSSQI